MNVRKWYFFNYFAWIAKTLAIRILINLQDKLGLYSYSKWIRENEVDEEVAQESVETEKFFFQPLIIHIIVWDGGSIHLLEDTLRSLINQIYNRWGTWVLDVSSNVPNESLKSSFKDRRINYFHWRSTLNTIDPIISVIQQVSGDYVQVLTAGDRLSDNSNYEIARTLNNSVSSFDIIYTDEDYIPGNGENRLHPFFKPDWSPELFLSTNYLLNAVFRSGLLAETLEREFPSDFEDLVLSSIKHSHNIYHIAKVLYHYRKEKGGREILGKYANKSAFVNKSKHLGYIGIKGGSVNISRFGAIRVSWPIEEKSVCIVIPTKDHVDLLHKCVNSILGVTSYRNYEIILVDNSSEDLDTLQYYAKLRTLPQIRIINYTEQFNFSRALNLGAQASNAKIYVFLNNDTEVIEPDWLRELVMWADQSEIGIVGAKLLFPDGRIQHAGIVIGLEGHAHHIFSGMQEGYTGVFGSVEWYRNYSAVTGACMAIRSNVYEKVGGFDEHFRLAFGDVDMCLRVTNAGYRVVYTPFARIIHHEGATRGNYIPIEDIKLGYERFKSIVKRGDPYYNPNLSYAIRVPTLKRRFEETPIKRLERIVDKY